MNEAQQERIIEIVGYVTVSIAFSTLGFMLIALCCMRPHFAG